MFLLKYILFHAMKQIANACSFYYYGCTTPSTPVKSHQYFYEKKISFYLCICCCSVMALAKQRCTSEELALSKKIGQIKT